VGQISGGNSTWAGHLMLHWAFSSWMNVLANRRLPRLMMSHPTGHSHPHPHISPDPHLPLTYLSQWVHPISLTRCAGFSHIPSRCRHAPESVAVGHCRVCGRNETRIIIMQTGLNFWLGFGLRVSIYSAGNDPASPSANTQREPITYLLKKIDCITRNQSSLKKFMKCPHK